MGKSNSKLKPTDILELREQTEFTEEELSAYYKDFCKEYPSGSLTCDEFKEMYQRFFPDGDANAFAQHVFSSFDENGDGKIDFREFVCGLSVTIRGNIDQKLKWAFSMYDLDKNGWISEDEMLEIVSAIYRMLGAKSFQDTPAQKVKKMFSAMDVNKDGKLTFKEFLCGFKADPSLINLLSGRS
ncbi:neurocalcin homolog [Hydra vulgaris]|uniref:Neurocalcin homolog n=1 Tax=Hydra vulgaris TaxID=6087 RepID=A0ABM4D8H3_HYDVU